MDVLKVSSIPQMRLHKGAKGLKFGQGELGSLHLTPHHLIFRSTLAGPAEEELWIPYAILTSVTRTPQSITGQANTLLLRTRDFQVYHLAFERVEETDGVWDSIKAVCSSVTTGGLDSLYPFCRQPPTVKGKEKGGWDIYDAGEEFARMGVGSRSKAWRCSTINSDYQFCPSYPAKIMVPAKISDTTLGYAVKYRSKGRIPVLVYLHWANLGSITRSSQPMVGLKNARSIQDEKLIESIFSSHSQHSNPPPARHAFSTAAPPAAAPQIVYGATATNLIIDARPTTNALANSVKGAGTENMEHYHNCKKAYLGIDNIHVMRSSLAGVDEALREAETTGILDPSALRKTRWLKHLSNILDGILVVTRTIHLSNSHVLVHCSDGWDRTSQLSSLAQLCLDPFYRTARGLAVLIEKDWVSYGHKFADRTGHLCGDKTDFITQSSEQSSFLASVQKQFSASSHAFKETCPVFQQFLDCIYQIQRQFPARFEWNETLLRRLQRETYAGGSGTFLWNSEQQREEMQGRSRTSSIWEEIFDQVGDELRLKAEFVNEGYEPSLDDPQSRLADADQGVLLPEPSNVRWWYELFGRADDEMNAALIAEEMEDVVSPVVDAGEEEVSPLAPTAEAPVVRLAPPRSESPGLNRSAAASLPSQAQLGEAVSSVQKFGWGAWKSVQKGYQEAVTNYRESTPPPPSRPVHSPAPIASLRPTVSYDPLPAKPSGAPAPSLTHDLPPIVSLAVAPTVSAPRTVAGSANPWNPTTISSPSAFPPARVLETESLPAPIAVAAVQISGLATIVDAPVPDTDPLGVGL